MTIGRSHITGDSKSKILELALRQFYNSLPAHEQENYLRIFDSLTDEQRKRPNKI